MWEVERMLEPGGVQDRLESALSPPGRSFGPARVTSEPSTEHQFHQSLELSDTKSNSFGDSGLIDMISPFATSAIKMGHVDERSILSPLERVEVSELPGERFHGTTEANVLETPVLEERELLATVPGDTTPLTKKLSKAEAVKLVEREPGEAKHCANLADLLEEDEEIDVSGKLYCQKSLFAEACVLDPNYARAFADLGCVMSTELQGSTIILDGKAYGEKELYVRALELDPTLALTYLNLHDILEPHERVLINGVEYDADALAAKSDELGTVGS